MKKTRQWAGLSERPYGYLDQSTLVQSLECLGRNPHPHPTLLLRIPDPLGYQIGVETTLGFLIGMGHCVSRTRLLPCNRAYFRHVISSAGWADA